MAKQTVNLLFSGFQFLKMILPKLVVKANLGELARAGFPNGFIVTADAYYYFATDKACSAIENIAQYQS